jgi:hypothetical protein
MYGPNVIHQSHWRNVDMSSIYSSLNYKGSQQMTEKLHFIAFRFKLWTAPAKSKCNESHNWNNNINNIQIQIMLK